MSTYNPRDVKVIINGIPASGYAKGDDVISIEYDEDFVGSESGVTGEAAFLEMNDRRATVKLKLMQTAAFNDALSAIVNLGTEFAMTVVDSGGRTIQAAAACRILRIPNVVYGGAIGTREWTIKALEMVSFVGGSNR